MLNLKQTLLLDATSAALFIVLCLGFTHAVSTLLGLPASIIAIAGWICVPSAALFVHQAFAPSRALVSAVVIGNAGWVLASIAVWVAYRGELTAIGHGVVIAQAIAVEAFTVLEWRGLKALRDVSRAA